MTRVATTRLAAKVFAADAGTFPGLQIDVAQATFARIVTEARTCATTGTSAEERTVCVVTALFNAAPLSPTSDPTSPVDSTMTSALTAERGSCAALVALALATAQDCRIDLEAWVRGEHVVVAAPGGTGYFELLENGRFHPWKPNQRSASDGSRGTRATPQNFLGYYLDNLAVRLASAGELDRAAMAFERAIEATPKAGRIRFNYGTFLLERERTDEAIIQLSRAVRLDRKNADAWMNLGVAQARAGDSSRARKSFEKALRIDPRNANAHRNLEAISTGSPGSASPPR